MRREPDAVDLPQPVLVEPGEFSQGVVPPAMGIAGPVVKLLQFAEHSAAGAIAERLLHLLQGNDGMTADETGDRLGRVGLRPHNGTVDNRMFSIMP